MADDPLTDDAPSTDSTPSTDDDSARDDSTGHDAATDGGETETAPEPDLLDDAQRRFPVPDYGDLPEDLRDRLDEETERAGFTPNVMSALAYKPSHFRAFMAFHDALVDDTTLDREEVEMIVVAVSGRNHCLYCNVAHGALVRIYSEDPNLADQLISNYRLADVSDERMAMLEVAVTLTEDPDAVTTDDLDLLREAGYTEEEVWDIGMVAAFFNLSNRMATFADWRPNEEFYTMGR